MLETNRARKVKFGTLVYRYV